jgi:hypothetical protein
MIRHAKKVIANVVFFGLLSGLHAQTMVVFQNNALGVSMRLPETYYNMIPQSMRPPTAPILAMGQGWAGIKGLSSEKTGIIAAKKDTLVSDPQNLLPSLVTITTIPANLWQLASDTVNLRGWTKFKAYQATSGNNVAAAIIGTGTSSSYMICFLTTISATQGNNVAETWFNSVTLLSASQSTASTQTTPPASQPAQTQTPVADTAHPNPVSQPAGSTAPRPQPKNKAKYK